MKKFYVLKTVFLALLFAIPATSFGQSISGKVTDQNGANLPFVNVIEKGTTNGVTTSETGEFTISVKGLPVTLVVSSIGFTTIEKEITSTAYVTFVIKEDNLSLDEVVITGNRAKPRTILDSPVPIDNINSKELQATGQTTIDHMLTYKIPSYNASSQTISDATAHFDPADLRGLGPSRTLVLVNGKRKNQSALVYVNDTPGKGEVGTDMKSIPTAAIERIEVLRDGASSQYGSDAVAGVINIILKKNVDYTEANFSTGITSKGDGFNVAADINSTVSLPNDGFMNLTVGLSHQDYTDRAGEPGGDGLFGVIFGDDDILNGTHPWLVENPDMGMTVGQPKMQKADVFVNAEMPFKNGTGNYYLFGGVNIRKGQSFALYRTPYWVPDPHNLLHDAGTTYEGFQPTFETDIADNLFGAGMKFEFLGFNADLSVTYGGNSVDYTIGNTLNPDLGADSPTTFNAGGYAFSNILGNFDINKSNGAFSYGFGIEARQERFKVIAGEEDSYTGGGAQSFPGLQPGNALNETRTNVGAYGLVDWDISDDFLIGGSVRYENFSDFGSNVSWKINSRYKFTDNIVARGSYSTGFRAPSLHQIYLSNVQTLVSGGTISNQGTFNNVDPVIKDLGVASLFAETSKNMSGGFTVKASKNFSLSLDFYDVRINDRVLFTGEIGATDDDGVVNTAVETILNDNSVTSIKFFINGVNTVTKGMDFLMNYNNINVGSGKLAFNFGLNLNNTDLDGEVKTPSSLSNYKNKIFNRKEQARLTDARPKTKVLFGATYSKDKFNMALSNTYFGEVTWQHASDPGKDQVFAGKTVTDLSFGYAFSEKLSANLIVNNLLDVYPDAIDTKGDFVTDLGGRFKYPWEVNQFGFNGTSVKAGLTFTF